MNATEITPTATFLLDDEEYVKRGGTSRFDGTPDEWAERFSALGGLEAGIRPAWITGAPCMTFTVSGTVEAIDFVQATAPLRKAV